VTANNSRTYASGSDLAILNERCLKNGLPSPVEFDHRTGRPYIKGKVHIDLYEVFRKEMVKSTIFKNRYRTLKLDDVAQALLGRGKLGAGEITGANVAGMAVDVQKSYVLQDAKLVVDLVEVNGGQLIALMKAIAELVGLGLEQTCHSSLSAWWTKVFDDMGCVPPAQPDTEYPSGKQQNSYQGGFVIEPKRGVYAGLKVVDVVSLYPSMAILHNISFDTVNCACCINRGDARVPQGVIDKGYWICRQKEGAFPQKLREFRQERVRQKKLGNEVRQLGLKILINGGYGLFGSPAFKYADVRVAELVTAYGRQTLRQMSDIAQGLGLDVVAGDTDSLFLDSASAGDDAIAILIARCREEIGIDVEHGLTFARAVIIKKKHYFGVTPDGAIKAVGMEGRKNDRPAWVNRVFDQFLQDFAAGIDPADDLKAAVDDLEKGRVDYELLKVKVKLSKDPADYAVNNPSKKIGALLGAKAGDVIWYFKTDDKKAGVSINPEDIGITKYKEMLMATVKDALEIMGYGGAEKVEMEIFGIVKKPKKKRINRKVRFKAEAGLYQIGDARIQPQNGDVTEQTAPDYRDS
jgi:DNA polymerase I